MINKEYVLEFTKKYYQLIVLVFTKNIINFLVSECESRNLDFYKNNKGNLFINFPGK